MTTSDDGIQTTLDQNVYGNGQGCLFKYAYTAAASGQLTLTFQALDSGDTWHHYAFSNEVATSVYLDPNPTPGSEISIYDQLSWSFNGVAEAPVYHLKIATDLAMSNLVEDVSGLSATTFDPTLNPETDYYWQVEVSDQSDTIYTSPVWSFATSPVPPDAVKLLEWKFDETQGTVAEQTGSASGGNGVLIGFNDPDSPQSHVTGLVNNALYLDGADEHIDVSSAHSVMPTADGQGFSISGYVCTFADYGPLFSMRNSTDETPIIDIALGADGVQVQPGKICVLVRDNAGSMKNMNSGKTVNDGQWHNVILTRYDDDWTLMIDGQSQAVMEGVAGGELTLDWLGIGASLKWIDDDWQPNNSHFRYFNGMVDEFTVWSGQLQPPQMMALIGNVPSQGDINWDHDTDLSDFAVLAADWFASSVVPVQPDALLEDMESYTVDPGSCQEYWAYTDESDFGDLALSMVPDPDGSYGQVMQIAYDFNGNLHAHVPFRLLERRVNLSLYDQLSMRIRKSAGCDVSKIILDFYDGRYNVDPAAEGMHEKGRLEIDILGTPEQSWQNLVVAIPDDITFTSCRDLYQILVSIEDGGSDTGELFIDRIELMDQTTDCVPQAGRMTADMNDDCIVDLEDMAELLEDWLHPF